MIICSVFRPVLVLDTPQGTDTHETCLRQCTGIKSTFFSGSHNVKKAEMCVNTHKSQSTATTPQ